MLFTLAMSNHPHIPSILHCCEVSSTRTASSRETFLCGTDSQEDISPITTLLARVKTVIFLNYPHKLPLIVQLSTLSAPWALYRGNLTVKKIKS